MCRVPILLMSKANELFRNLQSKFLIFNDFSEGKLVRAGNYISCELLTYVRRIRGIFVSKANEYTRNRKMRFRSIAEGNSGVYFVRIFRPDYSQEHNKLYYQDVLD